MLQSIFPSGALTLLILVFTLLILSNPSIGVKMPDFPLSPIDRKIDALGAEENIRSEEDAASYVDALLEKFQLDETQLLGLSGFRSALVHVEFTALLRPQTRIPEPLVGQVFNELMDQWQMPSWSRVSPEELHAFRATMSLALYPKSVSRSADGMLAPTCRPVEALYLIYLLHSNMGVRPELRELVRAGRWPKADPQALPSQGWLGLHQSRKTPGEVQRYLEYKTALDTYVTAHPGSKLHNLVEKLFTRFGIQ